MLAMKNLVLALVLLVSVVFAASGCRKSTPSEQPAPAAQTQGPLEQAQAVEPAPSSKESCVDAWLSARKLDPYGHDEGTMYAGGTPLFDERTGETTDRLTYVFARHPDAKTACDGDAGSAEPAPLPER